MSRAFAQADRYRRTACPRPMSRKKLRSAVWLNRQNLTGERMLDLFGRKPGSGRFKTKLLQYQAELEKQQHTAVNDTVKAKIEATLSQLRNLFKPRVQMRVAKAARAK